jgi:myo-inositol-1(or 4)-monophosphatase
MEMTPAELEKRAHQCRDLMLRMEGLLLKGFSWSPGSDPERQADMSLESKKSFRDLVTKYDRMVEEALLSELHTLFPAEAVVGEESTAQSQADPKKTAQGSEYFWLVDPIDGTTNFSRAYPFFCSTLALSRWNADGTATPVVGVTFNPVSKELFWSFKGGGAWLGRERLRVSSVVEMQSALLTTGFASLRAFEDLKSFELFSRLTQETLGVRRDGSAALDMAYVASGRIDAYWEWGLSPWDLAAGVLLVEEASGQVTKHFGQRFDLFDGEVLATNSVLHPKLLERLK